MTLKMLYCFLIFSTITMVFNTNAELTKESTDDEDEESVLKFTLRTFSNPRGKWITQVHMEREGFPEEGDVPRVKFSVEQNKTGFSRPPHLVTHLSESFHTDNEVLEMENIRFSLIRSPHIAWPTGELLCRLTSRYLALPSDDARQWIRSQVPDIWFDSEENLVGVYIGISNMRSDDKTFKTVLGQPVTNDSEIMKDDEVNCGVWNVHDTPPSLTFSDCTEKRPVLCERQQKWVSKSFDASPWLEPETE